MRGLSVILPAYNEGEMIPMIAGELEKELTKEKIPYEIIFVSDGSCDDTWEKAAGGFEGWNYPEILEKTRPFLQDWHRQRWMQPR